MSRVQSVSTLNGFTVVELLIVMVIMGMLAAVATPWFNKLHRRSLLRSAAIEIETTLLATRMRAVRRNLPASVVIQTTPDDNGAFQLDTIEPDPLPPAPTPTPIQKLFLSSKSFRFVTVPASEKITFDGNGRRILPAPDADASIVIEGPIGGLNVNRITIDTGVGGRVKVITPVEWR